MKVGPNIYYDLSYVSSCSAHTCQSAGEIVRKNSRAKLTNSQMTSNAENVLLKWMRRISYRKK